MTEYIDKKEVIDFLMQTRKQMLDEGYKHIDFYKMYDALLHFQQYVGLMPPADVAEVSHGKWVLTVEQGSCYDYHVTAHCSNCGWDWVGKDDECVGNNRYVFSAFIKGKKELAEQFALDNAKQRSLYNFCPNCGSKMGDDEA